MSGRPRVIALDLEGTLISNALSVFPRPGLAAFLETCRASAPAVVLFTAVSSARVSQIQHLLADEGAAPRWFATLPQVAWHGHVKDLAFVTPADPSQVLLVDDQEAYVAPGQREQWLPIREFAPPYPDDDRELERVAALIRSRTSG